MQIKVVTKGTWLENMNVGKNTNLSILLEKNFTEGLT